MSASIFKNILKGASDGVVLKPHVSNYFFQAKFPEEFAVHFKRAGEPRKPDGWFHPSTHPTMKLRQLYYYLRAKEEPELWESEQLTYESRMAVFMGTALHEFMEMALKDLGLLTIPQGTCVACGKKQPEECSEHGVLDKENNTRGHMDGITTEFSRLGTAGFDLKSGNNMALNKIQDLDLEAFKKKWPYYYGQGQSYMLSTGLRNFIFLFVAFGYPWTIREFIVPYDEEYCDDLRVKYKKAVRMAKEGIMPEDACCGTKGEASRCPAIACPMRKALLC